MFTLEEKPWSATDTLPWPPDHLRPYSELLRLIAKYN